MYLWEKAYMLLCDALPAHERRDRDGQLALLSMPNYVLYIYAQNSAADAFMAAYEFAHMRFCEHFAVSAHLRGQGVGANLLKTYITSASTPIILEVEPAHLSPMAKRRIAFYERNGFVLNTYPYMQPPLNKGDAPSPLCIMSCPDPLSKTDFAYMHNFIYQNVYGLNEQEQAIVKRSIISAF